MMIRVDPNSLIPPYEQIREQIETMAMSGVLAPGARLPSIRQLAADLGVAPGTVAHAYGELGTSGIIQTRTGRGTVVAGKGRRLGARLAQSEVRTAAEAFTRRVHQLGVPAATALAIVSESLGSMKAD
jgi:DNA-binding transcriptional regulator YhcF (GntR family)